MKLSDVMSALNLAVYAEVGLVLFMLAFTLVALDVLRRGRKLERLAYLPLDRHESESDSPEEHS